MSHGACGHAQDARAAIRAAFEDRGWYEPWWGVLARLRLVVLGALVFAGAAGAWALVSAEAGYLILLTACTLGLPWAMLSFDPDQLWLEAAPAAACPNLDALGPVECAALASALVQSRRRLPWLRNLRRTGWTRSGAQAVVFRSRAAVLAALRLAEAGRPLPTHAPSISLDRLIDAALAR